MAGETRGELAEAIAKVALENALAITKRRENVYWEEAPDNSVNNPDLTTGKDKNFPSNIVLVNASTAPKNSAEKYWRNIAEVFEAKVRLNPKPSILNLVFISEIKPELIKLTASLCDNTHLVDRDPIHGPEITRWLETNHASAPPSKEKKEALVKASTSKNSVRYDSDFAKAIMHLSRALVPKLYACRPDLEPLWKLVAADFALRKSKTARSAKKTVLRRGLSRWLVFDETVRDKVLTAYLTGRAVQKSYVPDYSKLLGMLNLHINGGYIPSNVPLSQDMIATTALDLRMAADFYKAAAKNDISLASESLLTALQSVPYDMQTTAEMLRSMPTEVKGWHSYVTQNWEQLRKPLDCFRQLLLCHADPTMGGKVNSDGRVWLYDHLVAVLRTSSGRNNDFGYGALVAYFKANRQSPEFLGMMNQILKLSGPAELRRAQRWINETLANVSEPGRRGFQDWLSKKKLVSPVIVGAFAFALAKLLTQVNGATKLKIEALVSAHSYGLWNKLLTYPDFEPLVSLIETACSSKVKRISARTLMFDLADRNIQEAGRMPALAFKGGLICWKSVTDAGKDHKRKELCGRGRALRFQKTAKGFMQRLEAKQLFLIVDGTFNDRDLQVLSEAGWDRIFYPDEMDQLVKAINRS